MDAAAELRRTFALANAFKQGDLGVGGTTDDRVRDDARRALAAVTLGQIRRRALVDDAVTAALDAVRDRRFDAELDGLTVGAMKAILLGSGAPAWLQRYRGALSSESIAALAKVMNDDELSHVARAVFNPHDGDGVTIGAATHFGSRIQPNSPGDDEQEILFSILEGLSYGCGDVVIGVNPASDDLDSIMRLEDLLQRVVRRLELPTRYCVLSDLVKQHRARAHVHVDVAFQSLAGTSRAVAGMVGLDVDGVLDLARDFDALYFETGQGSEVTNGAAEGVDMVTLESRTYGVARYLQQQARRGRDGAPPWTIVNDVAGFIGPEVFRDPPQLERACLEDAVMAKLHGLTIGLDVCATFHMGIDPATLRRLTARLAERAAPAYLMAVAGNADPMLGYLTTSFRDHPALRQTAQRGPASAMTARLIALGALDERGGPLAGAGAVGRLYASYARSGGERRTAATLEDEGRSRLADLRARGFDLGIDDASAADARLDRIYAHARHALYAALDDGVLRDASPRRARIRTMAVSRDDYLAHPAAGERLGADAARTIAAIYPDRAPQVQVVISDGLNAEAINEQLREVLPPLRRLLAGQGRAPGDLDIVVENGRVRAGYEIGGLVGARAVVHLIGERPGTGLNTLSAYLTYGRDAQDRSRWSAGLDHSATTAVCGIHPRGRAPLAAAAEIAHLVGRMLTERRSGVALGGGDGPPA